MSIFILIVLWAIAIISLITLTGIGDEDSFREFLIPNKFITGSTLTITIVFFAGVFGPWGILGYLGLLFIWFLALMVKVSIENLLEKKTP